MDYGLWFMVYGLWFMVYGLWFMVDGLWFMVALACQEKRPVADSKDEKGSTANIDTNLRYGKTVENGNDP